MESAVFDAGLYVGVGGVDQLAQGCGAGGIAWFELYMAHEFAATLEQAGRIGQGCALEESYVHVRGEYIDVCEGRVSETGNGAAVVEEFADFVAADSHHVEPAMRDGSQFA